MLKDIVAELRGYGDCVTSQAADEIERLQAEVLKWQVEAGKFGPGMEAMEDLLEEEKAKVEGLRGRLKFYADWLESDYSSLPVDRPPGPPRLLIEKMRADADEPLCAKTGIPDKIAQRE